MNDYGDDDQMPGEIGDRSQRWFEEACAKVQTPGTILMVFGLISVFLAVASLAIDFVAPDAIYKPLYDWMLDLQKGQPQGAQQLPPYDEWLKEQLIQSIAGNAVSLICSVPIMIGGSKMKRLRGYGWGMVGSILAIIPCTNSCCCLSVPFGIWALVVLLNSDVKLAFVKIAAGSIGPGAMDD